MKSLGDRGALAPVRTSRDLISVLREIMALAEGNTVGQRKRSLARIWTKAEAAIDEFELANVGKRVPRPSRKKDGAGGE